MNLIKILGLMTMGIVAVASVAQKKQVLITYPSNTPRSEMDRYRTAIQSAVSLSAITGNPSLIFACNREVK